jgi:hypothetical protein
MRTFCLKSSVLGFCLLSNAIQAELTPLVVPTLDYSSLKTVFDYQTNQFRQQPRYVGKSVIADSIDNRKLKFRDRIYSYDLAIDNSGKAYVLYANPVPKVQDSTTGIAYSEKTFSDNEMSEIWLAVENTKGAWDKIPITERGVYNPTGLRLQLDSKGVLHIAYIEKRSVVLGGVTKIQDYLMYRTFQNGALSSEKMVGDVPKGNIAGLGGWRTYMAIAPNNQVYFLRESSTATDVNKPSLKLLIPDGNGNWTATELNFTAGTSPAANWYHLAGFLIDSKGTAHIAFGDYAYNQQGQRYSFQSDPVNDSTRKTNGYHNLWYASSTTLDGKGWKVFQLNEDPYKTVPTLYEQEFWVDLTLDENNNPTVTTWLHPVGTTDKKYNTSAFTFMRDNSGSWSGRRITRTFDSFNYKGNGYVEGMGAGLVKDQFGWHGVWDNSHSRPFEHESPRGGLIYRFSPDGKDWSNYQLLAEFSGEGSSLVKIDKQNRLNILVLGDHTDTQLYFLRYQLPSSNLMEVYPDRKFYYRGESVALNALVRNGAVGNFYVAAISEVRDERTSSGYYQPLEYWQLTPDLSWKKIESLNSLQPVLSLTSGVDVNGQILNIPSSFNSNTQTVSLGYPPFKNPDTNYTIYSVVARHGTNVLNGQWTTPLFSRQIIVNKTLPSQ